MLNENAKLWVEDLRKNGNLQGLKYLHYLDHSGKEYFCCMGRACVLYNENNPNDQVSVSIRPDNVVCYDKIYNVLPGKVREWLGLNSSAGDFDGTKLTHLNDNGKTFAEIANIIESEPEGLFV